jgi:UDP-glucose:(heptosyl)LPS alpha-1,3-glucosyltransferase
MLLRAERKLCEQPNGPVIAALSQYVVDQLKQHYGTDAQRIVLIPNGIETNIRVDPAAADRLRTQILTQLGPKGADNPVLFLLAANNFRLKGLSVLIEAMHLATTFHSGQRDSCLVVAGSGRQHRYRDLANKLDVGGRILFLGPTRDIRTLLTATDVAVLPTFYDPSSRFILEAIAAGKPVITTRFNGAADLFTNNRHGKIIDTPEDIDALTDAIGYFTNTENIQKASQAIAADNLREKICIDRVARQLISLYESILQSKGQR